MAGQGKERQGWRMVGQDKERLAGPGEIHSISVSVPTSERLLQNANISSFPTVHSLGKQMPSASALVYTLLLVSIDMYLPSPSVLRDSAHNTAVLWRHQTLESTSRPGDVTPDLRRHIRLVTSRQTSDIGHCWPDSPKFGQRPVRVRELKLTLSPLKQQFRIHTCLTTADRIYEKCKYFSLHDDPQHYNRLEFRVTTATLVVAPVESLGVYAKYIFFKQEDIVRPMVYSAVVPPLSLEVIFAPKR